MNDVLHPGFDPLEVEVPLEAMVTALRDAGAVVLTATLPDVTRVLPLPARRRERLRDMLEGVNGVVRRVSARHDTILVDAADFPEELHARNWSLDRLHPNSRGHLLIARAFAAQLSELRGVAFELPGARGGAPARPGIGPARPVGGRPRGRRAGPPDPLAPALGVPRPPRERLVALRRPLTAP